MSEKNWAPGFIQLTRKTGVTYRVQIAEISRYEAGSLGETDGSYITLRGTDEERFVVETPAQMADLIRQEWENRISRDAEIRWASTRGERL